MFAVPEFRALWAVQLASVAGDQLARVALTVLVYDKTNSALLAAVTFMLSVVPVFVGGITLAWLADKFPRRQVMITCDLLRCALVLVMALPGMPLGVLVPLLAVVTLVGAPFTAARAAIYPDLLPGEKYVAGTAVTLTTNQFAQMLGFAVGGAVVALVGTRTSLLIDAATFAVSAAVVRAFVRHWPAQGDAPGPAGARGAADASGPSGACGAAGASGPSGAVGACGAAGASGPSGACGAAGASGPSGAVDACGAADASGAVDACGAVGALSAADASGPSGAAGGSGPSGAVGACGASGAVGAAGASGATGLVGARVAAGPPGAAGASVPASASPPPARRRRGTRHGDGGGGFGGSARTVFMTPAMLLPMLFGWLAAFYNAPEGVAAPLASSLGGGAAEVGAILAAQAFGETVGMLALGRLVRPTVRLRLMGPLSVITCAALILFALHPSLPVALAILFVSGAFGAYQIAANAAFVSAVPGAWRARAFGLAQGGMSLGQGTVMVVAGAAAQRFSSATVIAVFGAVGAVCAAYVAVSWVRSRKADAPGG